MVGVERFMYGSTMFCLAFESVEKPGRGWTGFGCVLVGFEKRWMVFLFLNAFGGFWEVWGPCPMACQTQYMSLGDSHGVPDPTHVSVHDLFFPSLQ